MSAPYDLDAVRRQPAAFLGPEDAWHSSHARLLQWVVGAFMQDTPAPPEIRVLFLDHGLLAVASDGAPLPLQTSRELDLHRYFTDMLAAPRGVRSVLQSAPVLNALSQMLTVFTMHDGECHQIMFVRGVAPKPLAPAPRAPRRGNFWVTYRADATILGERNLTLEQARDLVRRMSTGTGIRVLVEDHSNDQSQKG